MSSHKHVINIIATRPTAGRPFLAGFIKHSFAQKHTVQFYLYV
jgi:hypothetical protein